MAKGKSAGRKTGGKTGGKTKRGADRALAEYRKKRDFRSTPEPSGERAAGPGPSGGRSFVVQKHAASRLHYDFRLELDGVLASWAVPKGPSLDPADKRLAVHVEDHPLDYGDFEGTIPAHQYGGGTVLLWDRGTWEPVDGDEAARKGLREGKLHFRLDGEKLSGGWILVRMHGPASGDGKNWLLIKEDDEAARPGEGEALVDERTESVASGREMEEIAADPDRVWPSNREEGTAAELDLSGIEGAKKGELPAELRPMLATLVDGAPAGDGWLHEIKHDGYRLLCRVERPAGRAPDVRLLTRTGKDWTARFEEVAAAVGELPVRAALLDGEAVALTPDGTSSFARLQQALGKAGGGRIVCYLFDLLHLDGVDLRRSPLVERKRLLAELLSAAGADGDGLLRLSDHVVGRGEDFLRRACRHAVEGVVSKRAQSSYAEGRSRDWRKVKCGDRQEFVVGGFTEPSGSRTGFGSLLLGVFPPGRGDRGAGELAYAGRVGTGFDHATLEDLRGRLDELEVRESPFDDPRRAAGGRDAKAKGIHWVRPDLVAEVAFTEWTEDGVLRHPSFRGLREDKAAADVVREPAEIAVDGEGGHDEGTADGRRSAEERKEARMARKVSREAAREDGSGGGRTRRKAGGGAAEVAGVRLTHPDRVVYPDQGATKRDLALYYQSVAERILPHLAGRPLSLVRCPKGREGECFYQKHVDAHFPDAVVRIEVPEKDGTETYGMVDSVEGLVAMVQMGVLELHTWGARHDRIERPDRLVFDLDPEEGLGWDRVVEAAVEVRDRLTGLGLESFVKTTGGKGLHVVAPIERRIGWDGLKDFARGVAESMVRDAPGRYTDNMSKAKRKGKVFVDYLRNGRGATFIAAYSTRAKPGATVSVPVRWDELGRVRPDGYDLGNLPRRLASWRRDPWEGFDEVRQSVTAKMRKAVGAG